jgi:hypothetical protein
MSIGAYASAETNAKDSFACGLGIQNKAKASLGSWIVLSEWIEKENTWILKSVKTAKIDGKILKPDTFYKLSKGKIVKSK